MKRVLLHIILSLFSLTLLGQSLENVILPGLNPGDIAGHAVAVSENGTVAVSGNPGDSDIAPLGGSVRFFLLDGNTWVQGGELSVPETEFLDRFGEAVAISGDGNFIAVGANLDDDEGDDAGAVHIYRRDGNNYIYLNKITAPDAAAQDWFGSSLALNRYGTVLAVGSYLNDGTAQDAGAVYVFEREGDNWSFNTKITANDADANDNFGYRIALDAQGNDIAISAYRDDENALAESGSVYVFKEQNGTWSQESKINPNDASANAWFGQSLDISPDGNSILVGASAENNFLGSAYIFKNTSSWQQIQKITAPDGEDGDSFGQSVSMDAQGNFILVGAYADQDNGSNSGSVYVFSGDGNSWAFSQKITPADGAANATFGNALAISEEEQRAFIAAEGANSNAGALYAISLGDQLLAQGTIIADINGNCLNDAGDLPVSEWLIGFQGAGEEIFSATNNAGGFNISIPETGSYQGTVYPPNPYWEVCSGNININNDPGTGETNIPTVIVQPVVDCPYLNINIASPELERCYNSVFYVHYNNEGTTPANDAYIEITFDEFLEPTASDIPWSSVQGRTYRFDLGTLDVFEEGTFRVYADVSCEAVLGQTHCVEGRIYPQQFCFPDWNGDVISLEAECDQGEVEFRLHNIGTGNMINPRSYIIIEDMVMRVNEDYQLDAGQDQFVLFQADGATVRMETTQAPAYPYPSQDVSVSYEGCGTDEFGNISTGFLNILPDGDDSPFRTVFCAENTGSFDPNDKQAVPVGYDSQHFIEEEAPLEYLIRFQNTGTDTAELVVIRDTLDAALDPSSIELQGASHPFEFSVEDNGALEFRFPEIMLPDSTTNEPESHGYVQFTVYQDEALPLGTVIENEAAIYFDFNEPIITNMVFHTLGEDFIPVELLDMVVSPDFEGTEISLGPNPADEFVLIEIKGASIHDMDYSVFDALGRNTLQGNTNNNPFYIDIKTLESGIYFLQLSTRNQMVATAKIIVR